MKLKTFLSIVACVWLLVSSTAFGTELKTEPEVVQLVGTFVKPEYKDDETGKKGRYYAINLDTPVDVDKDDFGDAVKGVKLMQLVLMGDSASSKAIVKKYSGKKIKVTGTLFHAHTAHHMTKVLLQVQRIEER